MKLNYPPSVQFCELLLIDVVAFMAVLVGQEGQSKLGGVWSQKGDVHLTLQWVVISKCG